MEQFITFLGNNALLSAAWFILVIFIVIASIKIRLSPIKQLSPQELTFLVNRENGIVIDIRAEKDFKKEHIIDAINFSNEKITAKETAGLEKYKDRPIIITCASGLNSPKAASVLLNAGFTTVNTLKGGISAWQAAGLPLAKK